jgi:hypothetical protein
MKKLISLLALLFLILSCSNDDKVHSTNIIGTWKLYQANIGASNFNTVKDGYTYTFNTDGTFKSTRFTECQTGTYAISSNVLTLDYGCEDFTTSIESPAGTFLENYKLEKGYMYLSPTYLFCDEGCSYKFSKIKD